MNGLQQWNQAMAYVEDHLDGEIDYQRLAQITGCSLYHFRRMFSFLAGMPLGEYIRNRRLTVAAAMLRDGGVRILDIALRFGYESPDAFTKAFLSLHGVTPMQVKKGEASVLSFHPLTFQLKIEGGYAMDVRIVEKKPFYLIGVSGRIPLFYNGPNPHTAGVWKKLKQEDLLVLMEYSQLEPRGILSAYANYEDRTTQEASVDLFVGIAAEHPLPERLMQRFEALPVVASTWAVFSSCGPHPAAAQEVWARIADTWFPASTYQMTGGPEITRYESYDFGKSDFKTEIWIPIQEA